jgi:hypothetical protein
MYRYQPPGTHEIYHTEWYNQAGHFCPAYQRSPFVSELDL